LNELPFFENRDSEIIPSITVKSQRILAKAETWKTFEILFKGAL
jgi:hypothetical protein